MKSRLRLLLFLMMCALTLVGWDSGDDDDDDRPLKISTSCSSKFEDPNFGICKAGKAVDVTFCGNRNEYGNPDDDDGRRDDDDGQVNNDDDDGGPIPNKCRVCGDNQFEYIIRVTARTDTQPTLAITEFSYPVPSGDVIDAGWTQGPGTVPPTATMVQPNGVEWTFAPGIQPGQTSEDLYVCSFKGPDSVVSSVTCLFAVDAPGPGAPPNCLGPVVDCSQPPESNGLGEDDDDGRRDDDDGTADNDDDDDGGGFNPNCPSGPFKGQASPDDDDD